MPVSVEHSERRKLRAHILNHMYVVGSKLEVPDTFSFKKVYGDIICQEGATWHQLNFPHTANTIWGLRDQI